MRYLAIPCIAALLLLHAIVGLGVWRAEHDPARAGRFVEGEYCFVHPQTFFRVHRWFCKPDTGRHRRTNRLPVAIQTLERVKPRRYNAG